MYMCIQSLGSNYRPLNDVHAVLYSVLLSLTGMHCKTPIVPLITEHV